MATSTYPLHGLHLYHPLYTGSRPLYHHLSHKRSLSSDASTVLKSRQVNQDTASLVSPSNDTDGDWKSSFFFSLITFHFSYFFFFILAVVYFKNSVGVHEIFFFFFALTYFRKSSRVYEIKHFFLLFNHKFCSFFSYLYVLDSGWLSGRPGIEIKSRQPQSELI